VLRVVFVCSGNICRSPTAALVFSEYLRSAGVEREVEVDSAGIGGWHAGEPADTRAREVLARAMYPTGHTARQLRRDDLGADLVLAMDAGHLAALRRVLPDSDRVRMFRSFDPDAGTDLDVPDPYYGGPGGFSDLLTTVEAAMPGLLEWTNLALRQRAQQG
jgi:protein-tyrosine phosphatase